MYIDVTLVMSDKKEHARLDAAKIFVMKPYENKGTTILSNAGAVIIVEEDMSTLEQLTKGVSNGSI